MKKDKNTLSAFAALLRAGLWEQSVRLQPFTPVDYSALYALAEEQSVVGLIAAGLRHVEDTEVPKPVLKRFFKKVGMLVVRNRMMNYFIGVMEEQLREAGACALLLKGQGIAQCYEKPQWRASGDIDFFLDDVDYEKAKAFLLPLASSSEVEGVAIKHLGLTIKPWFVELHGTLRCGLSKRIDRELDSIQSRVFSDRQFRVWQNSNTEVLLPPVNEDIIYVFVHILQHFYRGGIGLRQICDWCRQLWVYRDSIDASLLQSRIHSMWLDTEWRAFAAYAVEFLGMPADAMPLFEDRRMWHNKARRIQSFIMKVGNFGHNRDMSYYSNKPYLVRKLISFFQRLGDLGRHACSFPLDSFRFFPSIVFNGLRSAAHGEG